MFLKKIKNTDYAEAQNIYGSRAATIKQATISLYLSTLGVHIFAKKTSQRNTKKNLGMMRMILYTT